jgi:plastocyanin
VTVTGARAAVLALAGVLVAVGCATPAERAAPPPSPPDGGLVISADDLAFDRRELVIDAGRRFALLFENREGPPHNISVLDPASGRPLFVGEIFGGPDSRIYDIPLMPAGAYPFRCDVHPEMTGQLILEAT